MKALISIYRMLSPAIHSWSHMMGVRSNCLFPISCSEYALNECNEARDRPWGHLEAILKITRRVIFCSPLHSLLSDSQKERF